MPSGTNSGGWVSPHTLPLLQCRLQSFMVSLLGNKSSSGCSPSQENSVPVPGAPTPLTSVLLPLVFTFVFLLPPPADFVLLKTFFPETPPGWLMDLALSLLCPDLLAGMAVHCVEQRRPLPTETAPAAPHCQHLATDMQYTFPCLMQLLCQCCHLYFSALQSHARCVLNRDFFSC